MYFFYNILEVFDRGYCSVFVFFVDFKKGFEFVDYNVLCLEMVCLDIYFVWVSWVKFFLINCI